MTGLTKKRVVIIGAGVAGRELGAAIDRQSIGTIVVGYLDDRFSGRLAPIGKHKLLGKIHDLESIVRTHSIDQVYIAIPSAEGGLIRRIVSTCSDAKVAFRIVPRLLELVEGHVHLDQVRDIQPEDLLGRAIIKSDQRLLRPLFKNQTVVVTGAAGSIGSELCRQLAEFQPKELLALDWSESALYDFENELRHHHPKLNLTTLIANVQDAPSIASIFRSAHPDFVFHAAAYKHVPLMERFPQQAVHNNILGTWNVARNAKKCGAKKFVLISTDKAVRPTSVMGASKAVAEILVDGLNGGMTKFSSVRFGNVLGSNGSVIPLFQKQIQRGGPVTLTHPDIVRYFMSIPEATQLILQATQLMAGGEIFVLDMGEPVKILDLAKTLIRLSGFRPEKDIPITFTGLRPGEKLYEELLTAAEDVQSTKKSNIFVTNKDRTSTSSARNILASAEKLVSKGSSTAIRHFLHQHIPDYHPTNNQHA